MIRVDTIYQRVLAAANKEQRGYVTPQEFNLFANQAQMDIFDQYFYDVDKFSRVHGNETETSDMLDILNEKIDIFEVKNIPVLNGVTLPSLPLNDEIYRLSNVMYTDGNNIPCEVERISEKEWLIAQNTMLVRPGSKRPVYIRDGKNAQDIDLIKVFGPGDRWSTQLVNDITCNYIRRPVSVSWAYVVVNGYAQYDNTSSIDFELHPAEENNLVHKILELAGIVTKDSNLYQIAAQEEIKDIQQEKA
tara:strand:+ start:79 stop:819 length:741 start_codon:yes stop_codon:yes gene_type:complete